MDGFAKYFAPMVSDKGAVVQISEAERSEFNKAMRMCEQDYRVRHMRSVWAAGKMVFTR